MSFSKLKTYSVDIQISVINSRRLWLAICDGIASNIAWNMRVYKKSNIHKITVFIDVQITSFKSLKFHAMNVPFRKVVRISKMYV